MTVITVGYAVQTVMPTDTDLIKAIYWSAVKRDILSVSEHLFYRAVKIIISPMTE